MEEMEEEEFKSGRVRGVQVEVEAGLEDRVDDTIAADHNPRPRRR
jgi:hypothetical protein